VRPPVAPDPQGGWFWWSGSVATSVVFSPDVSNVMSCSPEPSPVGSWLESQSSAALSMPGPPSSTLGGWWSGWLGSAGAKVSWWLSCMSLWGGEVAGA
jgi:hypothetical protein